MLVVDANVIAYLVIDGDQTAQARALYERDPDWKVPALWRYELSSALATLVKAEMLTLESACTVLSDTMALVCPMEADPHPGDALHAADRFRISAYDAQYVALAGALGVRCVTCDRKLMKAAPQLTVSLAASLS